MYKLSTQDQNARIRAELFIDGKWVEGEGEAFAVLNPFDNSEICKIHPASAAQVNQAVEAAYAAFRRPPWRKLTGRERGKLLLRLAQLLQRDLESFAALETIDTGIPIRETRMQIATAAAHLEYFAGLADAILGGYQDLGPRFNFTRREPFGVVGQIVPWNTPLKLMARGFAAAIACGNTMVFKPSMVAPLTNLRFSELVDEAGFPAGTVNIITGAGRSIGKLLTEHPKVRKIIFTGGTEGGREILRQAAQHITPAMLELGGKGPIIVCDNIDWDEAIDGVLTQAFARKAEVCFAGARLFVPSKLHDEFVSDLAGKAARIPMGNPLDVQTQLGPLVTAQRVSDILAQIEAAKKEGVKVFCGGEKAARADLRKGNFLQPTILTHVKPDQAVARDELFGPVLCVFAYDELDDAIRMANDSEYGLAGYVWSNDIRESHRIAQELEVGIVFVNAYEYQSEIPFGGYKESGMGREHGTEAIREYTQLKSVTVGMERFKSRFEI
jgi:(Z)-2-((N-methylformamido)methylene)-5-hydroxybutyrolactone dehydrogenase